MANRAAWLTHKQAHPFIIDTAPMPTPTANQLIVKVHAVAINPCDPAVQNLGILVEHFPSILGEDLSGEVTSTGEAVTRFKPGDRVVAIAADVKFGKPFSGSFQHFCAVDEHFAAKIPDRVAFKEACVLPLALNTAAACTHMFANLALPFPQLDPIPTGKVVLIWGASSSVGSCAVQLALASGLEVATTSSARNLQYCRDLGAKYVFDYKSESVVEDVVAALQGKESAGVMCAVGHDASEVKCAEIAIRLRGKKFVATVKPDFPAFPLPPEGAPEGVEMGHCNSAAVCDEPCGKAIWEDWLGPALARGTMKCKPDPDVVGQGLEKIQDAMDLMQKGVSARKLVVEL